MPDSLLQISVGGLFALMVIREVLGFLKSREPSKKNGKPAAGELSPEFWQNDYRKAVAEVVAVTIVPMLASQAAILSEMRVGSAEVNKNLALILDRLTQDRSGRP